MWRALRDRVGTLTEMATAAITSMRVEPLRTSSGRSRERAVQRALTHLRDSASVEWVAGVLGAQESPSRPASRRSVMMAMRRSSRHLETRRRAGSRC